MSQILFLRVGIDRGCGGTLSPRFMDGRFEYVPIPECAELIAGHGLAYTELPARSGGTLERYSGSSGYTHYDPEFISFTYGEPNEPKRSQLLKLEEGDHLVFYAGMKGEGVITGTCFVIGYFQIRKVHAISPEDGWPPESLNHLYRNAHFRRRNPEWSLVVAEGAPANSRLFDIAKQLSDGNQRVLRELEDVIGFGGSVKRAVGRWVPETHIGKALDWLRT